MKWLTVPQASKYIKISIHTLNEWRKKGKGPAFEKKSNLIRYRKEALDRYLKTQRWNF